VVRVTDAAGVDLEEDFAWDEFWERNVLDLQWLADADYDRGFHRLWEFGSHGDGSRCSQ
jgi:hypothetical protein